MEDEALMDLLQGNGRGGVSGTGDVARLLLNSDFSVNSLRTNDVLRRDEWIAYDNAVVQVVRERMTVVGDLLAAGLRYDLPNALGTTRLEWERMGDMGPAEINMSGVTEGRNDRIEFDFESMPIPIIHKDFWINIRALAASRKGGTPLDTTQAAMSARIVSETAEGLVFNGSTIAGTNGTIYGLLTFPQRTTGTVTANWATTATGEQMVTDVIRMIDAMIAKYMYGPFVLYVPYGVFTRMGNDFKAGSDKTIMQRLMEIPGISAIRPTTKLTASNLLLLQLTRDTIDLVVGMEPTTIQWPTRGGMVSNFKVMSIIVPRIRADINGRSGIVHYA